MNRATQKLITVIKRYSHHFDESVLANPILFENIIKDLLGEDYSSCVKVVNCIITSMKLRLHISIAQVNDMTGFYSKIELKRIKTVLQNEGMQESLIDEVIGFWSEIAVLFSRKFEKIIRDPENHRLWDRSTHSVSEFDVSRRFNINQALENHQVETLVKALYSRFSSQRSQAVAALESLNWTPQNFIEETLFFLANDENDKIIELGASTIQLLVAVLSFGNENDRKRLGTILEEFIKHEDSTEIEQHIIYAVDTILLTSQHNDIQSCKIIVDNFQNYLIVQPFFCKFGQPEILQRL